MTWSDGWSGKHFQKVSLMEFLLNTVHWFWLGYKLGGSLSVLERLTSLFMSTFCWCFNPVAYGCNRTCNNYASTIYLWFCNGIQNGNSKSPWHFSRWILAFHSIGNERSNAGKGASKYRRNKCARCVSDKFALNVLFLIVWAPALFRVRIINKDVHIDLLL